MDGQKRVAIIEDDADQRKRLRGYFSDFSAEYGESFDVSEYGSGEAFLAETSPFDIILMDIELPGKDGMETVRELRKRDRNVIVIFATNMAQFAVKGYEVEAFDFIVKPMTYYNFTIKIKRALERFKTKRDKDIWINVSGGAGRRRISTAQLKYVEVMGHRITYHTTDGNLDTTGSMTKVKAELDGMPFELCNRCYLVNLKFVEEVRPFQIVVGGEPLQVSHLKRNEFMSKLNLYLSTGVLSSIFLNKLLFTVEILVAEVLCTVYLKKRANTRCGSRRT